MTINYGGGVPNFSGGFNGYNGMGMMGMNSSMMGVGNSFQYFESKYGCEDCFRRAPYPREFPKPFTPIPENSLRPSLWQRFLHNVFGG